ncbi:uncharacterized protein [Solanum tuberosum]|uniref:uncharacterized protein n=1 Tax=Solanum tuberosum TaxID=4113 RepID=UPI00073A15F9|nr:PREDICTED: uncharacterized protein LOC107060406 [Solanum tuberosum]
MPGYAKFMKELVTKKRCLEYETIKVPHSCSAIMTNDSITKRKDLEAFTVPCMIGMLQFANALCDLGASINLMPYAIYKRLGLGEPKATTMRLHMADRSIKHPMRILYEILEKVDRFIFSTDFVILDCEIDVEIPIILGRPFLAIGRALVDVESRKLKFCVNDDVVTFNICKSMKQPSNIHVVSTNDVIDKAVASVSHLMLKNEPLEYVVANYDESEVQGYEEVVDALSILGAYSWNPIKLDIYLKNRESPPAKPSAEEPPNLDLKVLPSHLKYVFLGANNTLPVIIAANLLERQVKFLIEVLRKHIKAIGWTIADIVGIRLGICTNKIWLDKECKPSVEHQRRLNPPMQEVVKMEIIKWLDAEVIYPIADSIVLGHKVSQKGLEVDKAKIEVIEKLPPPISVKGVRSFLGQAGFYRRFIKEFSKIALPLCKLLEKEVKFHFNDVCIALFQCLKEKLISTPIIIIPNWSESFELMCDVSGMALGVVLGQKRKKLFYPIYYARKTLNSAQQNYTITKQELLAVVYAIEKFRAYFLGTKVIGHTDHAALRYLMAKKDAKP